MRAEPPGLLPVCGSAITSDFWEARTLSYDIICYGTLAQDIIHIIPEYPEAGGSVGVVDEQVTVGGEAANSCLAWCQWGLKVLLLGVVLGEDARADWLLERLNELHGLDATHLERDAHASTPYCHIMATPNGERTMFGRHFRAMRGQKIVTMPEARLFTLDPYCGENAWEAAALAKEAGMPVLAMDALGYPELARCSSVIVTSYQELHLGLDAPKVMAFAAAKAVELAVTVVVTLGPEGSAAFDREGRLLHRQAAIVPPRIVDATGCGDVYRAGLACGMAMDWPLQRSMAFASAAAACNLMGAGGGSSILSLEETLKAAETGVIAP